MKRINKFKLNFSPKFAIDLGSSRVRVWDEKSDLITDEPCCLAIKQTDGQILAVGNQALAFDRPGVKVIWPVVAGMVADKKSVSALLKFMLARFWRPRLLIEPTVAISVPVSSSNLEKQTVSDLLVDLGAKEVIVVAQPLAGFFGTGLKINDPAGSLGLCIGAGLAEAVVVSMGSVVLWQAEPMAGNWLIWQLEALLRREKGVVLSKAGLEQFLFQIANLKIEKLQQIELIAKNIQTGLPAKISLDSDIAQSLLEKYAQRYGQMVNSLFGSLPSGLTQDSFKRGLLLLGGAAKLAGLEQYLSDYLDLPVALVQNPDHAVIKGLVYVQNHLSEFKNQSTSFLKALPLS